MHKHLICKFINILGLWCDTLICVLNKSDKIFVIKAIMVDDLNNEKLYNSYIFLFTLNKTN